MTNKKITTVITAASIFAASMGILALANKAISQLAVSKGMLNHRDREIYHWRFGDISYTVAGQGKPLLLIHDLTETGSSAEWVKLIPQLSRNHQVYALDLLGCGLSDRPNITYTSYMYTQLISDFITNVIKKKTDVICTGRSCAFLLGACCVNSQNFGELILISPEKIKNLKKAPSHRSRTARIVIKLPVLGAFLYHLITARNLIQERFQTEYFYDPDKIQDWVVDSYYEAAHLGGRDARNLYTSIIGRYANADPVRALKTIDNDIHILVGKECEDIEDDMKEYQYYNPAVEVEYLSGCKRLPQLEAPQLVLQYTNLYLYDL